MIRGSAPQPAERRRPAADRQRMLADDLEHARRLCTRLKVANDKLVRSNQELTQFAYVASHDLQEPLRMVDSYLGLIERRYKGRLDRQADEFIAFATDGARRMKRLIDDLLGYSRVSNCALEVSLIDTGQVVAAVLGTLATQIEQCGAKVTVGPLPQIEADPGQLERLFTNLIGNALKFRGERAPRIAISAARSGGMWEFTVIDNGIGIEPEFHEKVFEIFARLHPRDQFEGSGIGLAACKRIVELHGGTIGVGSAPGGGAAFSVTLPEHYHEEEPAP
jgi:light-regulated signal transduction histidine kinase (bacteriophytochrome)